MTINRITGGDFKDVGPNGATRIEAIAWNIDATVLYAADAGTWGTINLNTGAFSSIGSFGSGDGDDGEVDFNDVDGLTVDPTTGIMYGSERYGDGGSTRKTC